MKTIILFLLANLFLFNTLTSQKTYVPDDNFEQALITLGHDTGPLDDSVTTLNIQNITSLVINGKNISNLIGIEDFRDLTFFSCVGNNLTNLDVSMNLAITNLICISNNLTSLDVTNNTALTHLLCYNNNLTRLDLTMNTNLKVLNCPNNNLHELNLNNNNNTKIIYLQTGNNPNLTCIKVDDTIYSQTNWIGTDYGIDSTSKFNLNCPTYVGINEVSKDLSLNIFPNPTNGILNIEFKNSGNYSLFSVDGKQVLQNEKFQKEVTKIDVSNLKTGMYLLRVVTNEGNVTIKRVIKQ